MSYYVIFNDTYQYLLTQHDFDKKFGETRLSDLALHDFMIIEILPEIIIESDIDLDDKIHELVRSF